MPSYIFLVLDCRNYLLWHQIIGSQLPLLTGACQNIKLMFIVGLNYQEVHLLHQHHHQMNFAPSAPSISTQNCDDSDQYKRTQANSFISIFNELFFIYTLLIFMRWPNMLFFKLSSSVDIMETAYAHKWPSLVSPLVENSLVIHLVNQILRNPGGRGAHIHLVSFTPHLFNIPSVKSTLLSNSTNLMQSWQMGPKGFYVHESAKSFLISSIKKYYKQSYNKWMINSRIYSHPKLAPPNNSLPELVHCTSLHQIRKILEKHIFII